MHGAQQAGADSTAPKLAGVEVLPMAGAAVAVVVVLATIAFVLVRRRGRDSGTPDVAVALGDGIADLDSGTFGFSRASSVAVESPSAAAAWFMRSLPAAPSPDPNDVVTEIRFPSSAHSVGSVDSMISRRERVQLASRGSTSSQAGGRPPLSGPTSRMQAESPGVVPLACDTHMAAVPQAGFSALAPRRSAYSPASQTNGSSPLAELTPLSRQQRTFRREEMMLESGTWRLAQPCPLHILLSHWLPRRTDGRVLGEWPTLMLLLCKSAGDLRNHRIQASAPYTPAHQLPAHRENRRESLRRVLLRPHPPARPAPLDTDAGPARRAWSGSTTNESRPVSAAAVRQAYSSASVNRLCKFESAC